MSMSKGKSKTSYTTAFASAVAPGLHPAAEMLRRPEYLIKGKTLVDVWGYNLSHPGHTNVEIELHGKPSYGYITPISDIVFRNLHKLNTGQTVVYDYDIHRACRNLYAGFGLLEEEDHDFAIASIFLQENVTDEFAAKLGDLAMVLEGMDVQTAAIALASEALLALRNGNHHLMITAIKSLVEAYCPEVLEEERLREERFRVEAKEEEDRMARIASRRGVNKRSLFSWPSSSPLPSSSSSSSSSSS